MSDFQTRRQRSQSVRQPKTQTENLYRRSRTLTGSISSRVASAVEAASQLRSPRLEKHDLHSHRRNLVVLLVGTLMASAMLAWLIDATIVAIRPADSISERYVSSIDSYYDQHLFERFTPLSDSRSLLEALQAQHPEILSVSLNGEKLYAAYSAEITLREPVAKWTIGDDTYYVDTTGIAYTIEQEDIRPIELLQIRDESGLPVASQRVASRSMMQFIGQVVAQLNQSNVGPVREVVIPPGTLKQIDIYVADSAYKIMLHSDRSPAGQATDVVNALGYVESNGITPEYLDVRVEGKAFYR